jgi:hypothetical protein
VKAGQYPERNGITHVNILRTIEAMYGLPKSGAQQEHVVGAGISDDHHRCLHNAVAPHQSGRRGTVS